MKRRICLLAGLGLGLGQASARSNDERGSYARPLRIAVTPGPQAEVMDFVARLSALQDLILSPQLHTEPASAVNLALASGALDAASVQDVVAFEADPSHPRLAEAALTLTQPMALYSRQVAMLRDLPAGASVALPADPAMASRALVLLYNHGLLLLKPGSGWRARGQDVLQTRRGLRLLQLPADKLADALQGRATLAVIDRAHAVAAGLQPARDSIGIEDARTPWAGLLSVRREDREAPWLPRLVAIYQSAPVRRFILERYQDSVRRPW